MVRWSALAETHGLRLVQLPLAEARRQPEHHPLEQLVPVKLTVRPPEKPLATPHLDPHSFAPRTADDPLAYQKLLLRKLDFVLDYEAAASFMTKLNVSYSWGRPEYELTQFVHKSGLLLAQISADEHSDFLLLPNRLATQRVSTAGKSADVETVEGIVRKVKDFCRDEAALKMVFEEANRPRVTVMSPFSNASLAVDNDVPPMQLPPHLNHRAIMKGI